MLTSCVLCLRQNQVLSCHVHSCNFCFGTSYHCHRFRQYWDLQLFFFTCHDGRCHVQKSLGVTDIVKIQIPPLLQDLCKQKKMKPEGATNSPLLTVLIQLFMSARFLYLSVLMLEKTFPCDNSNVRNWYLHSEVPTNLPTPWSKAGGGRERGRQGRFTHLRSVLPICLSEKVFIYNAVRFCLLLI